MGFLKNKNPESREYISRSFRETLTDKIPKSQKILEKSRIQVLKKTEGKNPNHGDFRDSWYRDVMVSWVPGKGFFEKFNSWSLEITNLGIFYQEKNENPDTEKRPS